MVRSGFLKQLQELDSAFLLLPPSAFLPRTEPRGSHLVGVGVVGGGRVLRLVLHHGPLRRPHRRALCCLLHVRVLPGARGPLLLRFAEAPAAPPVKLVHLEPRGGWKGEKTNHTPSAPPPPPRCRTIVRAMKEKTAIPVNRMVGISITTADPTLVPKKEIAAIQPLQGDGSHHAQHPSQLLPPASPRGEAARDVKTPRGSFPFFLPPHHTQTPPLGAQAPVEVACRPMVGEARPLPDTPARDPHGLDDADHQLGHEGEEEGHEAEGAVCPAREGSVSSCVSGPAALPTQGSPTEPQTASR